jgi:hypothetical protein
MPVAGAVPRVAAAETREPARAFSLDQRLERLADQGRILLEASESLRLRNQLVIEREGRAHRSVS